MRNTYCTEQKKCLIDFLKINRDKQYTINEMVQLLKDTEILGKSTIYRLVDKLVEDGIVRRFVKDNSRHFVYQLIDGQDCHSHLHLKCTSCGRLIHLEDDVSEAMEKQIKQVAKFEIDESKILLYGRCESCR